jgi:hypothetical protein
VLVLNFLGQAGDFGRTCEVCGEELDAELLGRLFSSLRVNIRNYDRRTVVLQGFGGLKANAPTPPVTIAMRSFKGFAKG